ncbi:hypothetical protein DPMN_061803 [Dreissena polymorpha]|uniref:Uncharacterized protein n=1 Tax=Dreissena polymorpha TaxID=45954 RepID=A0A9D4C834_DREPO|nr:hypothetical protein DPMN_061803 [Dreissena polymorpha]
MIKFGFQHISLMILEFSDQTPTEPRDKLPVKRSMIPSDASEEIDLTNNAAKQNLSSMLIV